MRIRMTRAMVGLIALLLIGGPVSASDFTGYEEDEQTLDCPAAGESVPNNQEPPGDGECDEETEATYQGMVWDNDVRCNDDELADAQGVKAYGTNSGTSSGGLGICNDGGTAPVQGRATAEGSMSSGVTVTIDGDKDNTPEQAQGWARVNAGAGGPSVTCGDANGKKDASHRDANDGQDDCG